MAMADDPDWLLSHIRHSFITSDDTGMCEMVIQNSDLLTLDEHRKQLRDQAKAEMKHAENTADPSKSPSSNVYSRNRQNCHQESTEEQPRIARAPSPDILSGWDFGVRRRSNTAQKLERIRKERQNRVKVKTIHWNQMPEKFVNEHLDAMFEKKIITNNQTIKEEAENLSFPNTDIASKDATRNLVQQKHTKPPNVQFSRTEEIDGPIRNNVSTLTGFEIDVDAQAELNKSSKMQPKTFVSALSRQLAQSVQLTHNPFKDYSKFDGRGHEGTASTQQINIFVYPYGEPQPVYAMPVVILVPGAKVQDLIGLTCLRYTTEKSGPALKRKDVNGYNLYIAEDDGEVDYGLPPMDSYEPVSKFSFRTLALVEKHQISERSDDNGKIRESVFVKVNDNTGFALIKVDNLSVTIGEILKMALKRRKRMTKYIGRYRLEYQDRPGVVLDEEQTLESTSVMEFCMVREHSARSSHNLPTENGQAVSDVATDSKSHAAPTKSVQFLGLLSTS